MQHYYDETNKSQYTNMIDNVIKWGMRKEDTFTSHDQQIKTGHHILRMRSKGG